jgi:hypothetical protein
MNVDEIIKGFDQIARASGQQGIMDLINGFDGKIPNEYKEVVMAQVKEEAAKAIAEGMQHAQSGINNAMKDPELMAKFKAMGPQDD